MINKALIFATEKHKTQIRKFNKEPYITHPIRVSQIVEKYTNNETLIIAALLHDTIEDTNTTYEEIINEFNLDIANIVLSLTNEPIGLNKLGKTLYLTQKINSLSAGSLLVKLADRLDNVSDMSMSNMEWSKSYANQTNEIINNLNNPNINDNHKALIIQITLAIFKFL